MGLLLLIQIHVFAVQFFHIQYRSPKLYKKATHLKTPEAMQTQKPDDGGDSLLTPYCYIPFRIASFPVRFNLQCGFPPDLLPLSFLRVIFSKWVKIPKVLFLHISLNFCSQACESPNNSTTYLTSNRRSLITERKSSRRTRRRRPRWRGRISA